MYSKKEMSPFPLHDEGNGILLWQFIVWHELKAALPLRCHALPYVETGFGKTLFQMDLEFNSTCVTVDRKAAGFVFPGVDPL